MLRKLKASKSATDRQLVELKQDGCTVAREIEDTLELTSAPNNTVAIVVDISSAGGAINIGKEAPNKYDVEFVDKIGVEDAKDLVILAWDPEWRYYTIGDVGIRYMVKE